MFEKEYKVIVKDFIKNEYAHNPEDGEIISNEIKINYTGDCSLILDFKGIVSVNTAFINKIVHGLYDNFDKETLNKNFNLRNYNELILRTFHKVIENYKEVNNDL